MVGARLFKTTVSTKRLAAVAGTKKETWATNLATLKCTIHPIEGTPADMLNGAFYTTFKMWCASGTDLLIGDRVVSGSTEYVVKGTSTYDFGNNTHLRATLVLGK